MSADGPVWIRPRPKTSSAAEKILTEFLGLGRLIERFARRLPVPKTRTALWGRGVSVVIPEHARPDLLGACLTSVRLALGEIDEPWEVIVSVNGSPPATYAELRSDFPEVVWVHHPHARGFLPAARRGVRRARFKTVYLLNNDMTVKRDAIATLLDWRDPTVFAISSQIFFADPVRRREETGWTAVRAGMDGWPEIFDEVPQDDLVASHPYAGGGASLFARDLLLRYMSASSAYDPFYWEDVEWGVRAWRDGLEVLFQPRSEVIHVHRATIARLNHREAIDRIVARNAVLFELRNATMRLSDASMARKASRNPDVMQVLIRPGIAMGVLAARWRTGRASSRSIKFDRLTSSRWLTPPSGDRRPIAIIVTPFSLLPVRHGGAVRTTSLARELAKSWRLVILADEPANWSSLDKGPFDEVRLTVNRMDDDGSRIGRMRSHGHPALKRELERLVDLLKPDVVQVEHFELAGLSDCRKAVAHDKVRWVLTAHDVLIDPSDINADNAERRVAGAFDAVVTCSAPDQKMLEPLKSILVPNGVTLPAEQSLSPSFGYQLMFAGPLRYEPNLNGIVDFIKTALPKIAENFPQVRLVILAGSGGRTALTERLNEGDLVYCQIEEGVDADGMRLWYHASAICVNPMPDIRGSSIKVLEALANRRVCVSTRSGARGLEYLEGGLVIVEGIEDFAVTICDLLSRPHDRRAMEISSRNALLAHDWSLLAARLHGIWRDEADR